MRGSVILTFDEFINDDFFDGIFIYVAGQSRYFRYTDSNRIYTTPINTGEVCAIELNATPLPQISSRIVVKRIDYTTDDVGGDNGIKETYIGEAIASSGNTTFNFTATTRPDAYGFEYRIECYTDGCFPDSFPNINGFNLGGSVFDSEIQPDGKILCSGAFTQYNGVNVKNVCRINSDGTLDTTFNFYQENTAFSNTGDIKLLSDGDILVRLNNARFGKIKSNGALDTSFYQGSFGSQLSGAEEHMQVQSDGKILLGGNFNTYTSAGQTSTKRAIVRLNSNGTIDTTFNQFGTGFTTGTTIEAIVIQSDKKILLAGGGFASYNGVTLNSPGLIRLNPDGSLDTSFIRNSSTNVYGTECELQSDGKILFYNLFGGYNGNSSRLLVRLNPDGSLDSTFPNTALTFQSITGPIIEDILVDDLDNIFLLGRGIIYSGTAIPSLCKLNPEGLRDTSFNDGFGFLTSTYLSQGTVNDMEINNTGSIYVVGANFQSYFKTTTLCSNIMKIRPNGTPFLC
jgi:uncharacterized delta-60 repeat protein